MHTRVKIPHIVHPQEGPDVLVIRQAAHVIKGAAANLMCYQLQASAADLESTAKSIAESGQISNELQARTKIFEETAQKFTAFVQSLS